MIFEYKMLQSTSKISLMGEKMMKKIRKSPIYEINTEAKSFIEEEVSEIQSIIQAEVNKFRNLYSNSIFLL